MAHLAADIAANGQREPATVWRNGDGRLWLLDGRHRAEATRRLGLRLKTAEFVGDEDGARALVLSANVTRRHLSPGQRSLAAGALSTRRPGGVAGVAAAEATLPVAPTQKELAAALGVSERTVRDGKAVMSRGTSELIEAVAEGRLSVANAAAAVRGTQRDRQAATALYLSHRRSSMSDSWLTPAWVLERAEACLGGIDGDVAAAPERNVPARWALTGRDDAMSRDNWSNSDGTPSRLWINPPYGASGKGPSAWTARVVREWEAGTVHSALLLLPARPGAHWQQALARFPRLEFRGHLRFEPGEGNPARERWVHGERAEAPFASILVGIGVSAHRLHHHFSDVGVVWTAHISDE